MIKIGEEIVIRHRSRMNPITGLVTYTGTRSAVTQRVNKVYRDGWIKTSSGDIYKPVRLHGRLVAAVLESQVRTEDHEKYWKEQ